ncbi:MAG: hypothetical protein ABSG14_01980 [Verrucomicrobiia bacterium]|jgi:deoxycytidine triphosphate deaminase
MGTLNKSEIERHLQKDELLKFARKREDGSFDLEPASYDLMAGIAVWKEPVGDGGKSEVQSVRFDPTRPFAEQPTVTLQPGQMMFVITREEFQLPANLCGLVLSRNKLAREGILALNAGHVDPGFRGPIVIRLINLRSTPWTLTLGEPIFTAVFQTVDVGPKDQLVSHPEISLEKTLKGVRESADEALSNALFDLYAREMNESFRRHASSVEASIRTSLGKDFITKNMFFGALSVIAVLVAVVEAWPKIRALIDGLSK